jgi:hypothetical protein
MVPGTYGSLDDEADWLEVWGADRARWEDRGDWGCARCGQTWRAAPGVYALLAQWEQRFGRLADRWVDCFLANPVADAIVTHHDSVRVGRALREAGPKLEAVLALLEVGGTISRAARAAPSRLEPRDATRRDKAKRVAKPHRFATEPEDPPDTTSGDEDGPLRQDPEQGWGAAPFTPADLWPDEGYEETPDVIEDAEGGIATGGPPPPWYGRYESRGREGREQVRVWLTGIRR